MDNKECDDRVGQGAVISNCKNYRYRLWRIWDEQLPIYRFIMLNPSTADASKDDPTIRRCVRFAADWGGGGLEVMNLFAFRARNPTDLKICDNPVGPENDMWLNTPCKSNVSGLEKYVICAWGTLGKLHNRADYVMDSLIHKGYCLTENNDGSPKHPLYCKKDLKPKFYTEMDHD